MNIRYGLFGLKICNEVMQENMFINLLLLIIGVTILVLLLKQRIISVLILGVTSIICIGYIMTAIAVISVSLVYGICIIFNGFIPLITSPKESQDIENKSEYEYRRRGRAIALQELVKLSGQLDDCLTDSSKKLFCF